MESTNVDTVPINSVDSQAIASFEEKPKLAAEVIVSSEHTPEIEKEIKPRSQLLTLSNFKKMLEKRPSIAAMFNQSQKKRNSRATFNYSSNSVANASDCRSAGKKSSVCTTRNENQQINHTDMTPETKSAIRRMSVGSNSSQPQICFFPRKRNVEKELPHLRKKYRGGFWGYGQQIESSIAQRSSSTTHQAKILLSHH